MPTPHRTEQTHLSRIAIYGRYERAARARGDEGAADVYARRARQERLLLDLKRATRMRREAAALTAAARAGLAELEAVQ